MVAMHLSRKPDRFLLGIPVRIISIIPTNWLLINIIKPSEKRHIKCCQWSFGGFILLDVLTVFRDRSKFIEAGDRCKMYGDRDMCHVFK